MGWIHDRWHQVAGAGSGTWLAWAVWALLGLGVVALIYANAKSGAIADWRPRKPVRMSGCSWSRTPPTGM